MLCFNPHVTVFVGETLGKWPDDKGSTLMHGTGTFIKETLESSLGLLLREDGYFQTRGRLLTNIESARTLMLYFQVTKP